MKCDEFPYCKNAAEHFYVVRHPYNGDFRMLVRRCQIHDGFKYMTNRLCIGGAVNVADEISRE
jgi:hypothetical protein